MEVAEGEPGTESPTDAAAVPRGPDLVEVYGGISSRLAEQERERERQRAAELPVADAVAAANVEGPPEGEPLPASQTVRRYKGDKRLSTMGAKLAAKRKRGGEGVRWVWLLTPSALSTNPAPRAARAARDPPGWTVGAVAVEATVRGLAGLRRVVCESLALPRSLPLAMVHCEAAEGADSEVTNDAQVASLASGDTLIVTAAATD